MAKMEKLDPKVYKVYLDPKVPWVTRVQLVNLEKMDFLDQLEPWVLEETLEKMVLLVSMDLQVQLDLWEKEVPQDQQEVQDQRDQVVKLVFEESREI